jgi:23S rRNA pseudouridine1911/1915/1917 synthase
MLANLDILVAEAEAGKRLDRLILDRWPGCARSLVVAAIEQGSVLVNGRQALKGCKVAADDVIRITELAEKSDVRVAANPDLPLRVVYEDEALLAFDKPAGMFVHPLSFRETTTLANAMIARYPALAGVGGPPLMPALLHRIDVETSGLVLAARTPAAYANLREQFRCQTVRKIYLALVRGAVDRPGVIESLLVHRAGSRHRMEVLGDQPPPGGQSPMRAVTAYEPGQEGGGVTRLKVTIFTGVTHQIRCQLAHAGHPIVGDRLYGDERESGFTRHHLHACEVTLQHPYGGRETTIRCEPPEGFLDPLG